MVNQWVPGVVVSNLRIGGRLVLLVSVLLSMTLAIGGVGLNTMAKCNEALASSYQNRLEPSGMIGRVMMLMADNRSQIMLGLQHNPDNPLAKMHDHPLARHTDAVVKNRDEITAIWKEFMKRGLFGEERMLAEKYAASRAVYVTKGLVPARDALLSGDYYKANEILLKVNSAYATANGDADALLGRLSQSAASEYQESMASYEILALNLKGAVQCFNV